LFLRFFVRAGVLLLFGKFVRAGVLLLFGNFVRTGVLVLFGKFVRAGVLFCSASLFGQVCCFVRQVCSLFDATLL
jgi:hypothetical protein